MLFQPAPEGYWLGAEEYATHTGGALDGQTTWRIYIHCVNETDYLSSVSGDDNNTFELNSNKNMKFSFGISSTEIYTFFNYD